MLPRAIISPRHGIHTHRIVCKVNARKRPVSNLAGLSEGFLDLAVALPYPQSWPPYASTVILLTVVTRLAFTVPISVWVCRAILVRRTSLTDEYIPTGKETRLESPRACHAQTRKIQAACAKGCSARDADHESDGNEGGAPSSTRQTVKAAGSSITPMLTQESFLIEAHRS